MKKLMMMFVLLSSSFSAFSANISFFSNTPISYFTKEDWKLSREAQNTALNKGIKVSWHNPRTGNHGVFLPSQVISKDGSNCRNLKIMNAANRMQEDAIYRFCKLENEWKIV
jgi:hypothetical protein